MAANDGNGQDDLMTQRFCKICRNWHDLEKPWPSACIVEKPDRRSHIPTPMLIQDQMEPTQSMLDGKLYTSKRAMRESYREHNRRTGENIVEVGDDSSIVSPKPRARTKPNRKDIKAAVARGFSQAGLGA